MNKERLKHLVEILKDLPEEKLDLTSWRRSEKSTYVNDEELHTCGTTACVVGWACADPLFKAQGLSYSGIEPKYVIEGGKVTGWEAVTEFFGISDYQASHLFFSHHYPDNATPEAVIDRIEVMLTKENEE